VYRGAPKDWNIRKALTRSGGDWGNLLKQTGKKRRKLWNPMKKSFSQFFVGFFQEILDKNVEFFEGMS